MRMIYFRCRNVVAATLLIILIGFYIWPKLPSIDVWNYPEPMIPFELDGSMAGQGFGRVESFDSQFEASKTKSRNKDFQAGDFYDVFYNPGEEEKKEKPVSGEDIKKEELASSEGDKKEEEKISGDDLEEENKVSAKTDKPTAEDENIVFSSELLDGKRINSAEIKEDDKDSQPQTEKKKKGDVVSGPEENGIFHKNDTNSSDTPNTNSTDVIVDEVVEANTTGNKSTDLGNKEKVKILENVTDNKETKDEESGNDEEDQGEKLDIVQKNDTIESSAVQIQINSSEAVDNKNALESTGPDEVEKKEDENLGKGEEVRKEKHNHSANHDFGKVDHDEKLKNASLKDKHAPSVEKNFKSSENEVDTLVHETGNNENEEEDGIDVEKKAIGKSNAEEMGPSDHEVEEAVQKNDAGLPSLSSKNVESTGNGETGSSVKEEMNSVDNQENKPETKGKNEVDKKNTFEKINVAANDKNKGKDVVNEEETMEEDLAKQPEETEEIMDQTAERKVEKSGAKINKNNEQEKAHIDDAPLTANKNSSQAKTNTTEKIDKSGKIHSKSGKEDREEIDLDSFVEYSGEEPNDNTDAKTLDKSEKNEDYEKESKAIKNIKNEDLAGDHEIEAEGGETESSDEKNGEVHYTNTKENNDDNRNEPSGAKKVQTEEVNSDNLGGSHKKLKEIMAQRRSKYTGKLNKLEDSKHGVNKEDKPIDQVDKEDANFGDGGEEVQLEVNKIQVNVGDRNAPVNTKVADVGVDVSHKNKESPRADRVAKYLIDNMKQRKESANVEKPVGPKQADSSNFGQPVAPDEDVSYN